MTTRSAGKKAWALLELCKSTAPSLMHRRAKLPATPLSNPGIMQEPLSGLSVASWSTWRFIGSSRVELWVITIVTLHITPLITTHEAPSRDVWTHP